MTKRRPATQSQLQRKQATREPYKKVLIVCEGEKTEPKYFEDLVKHFGISTANVVITGDCGSAPINVVDHGKKLYEAEIKDKYDNVYLVFDRDTHATYLSALQKVESLKPAKTFVAITSDPTFEYWFRLHFGSTRRPYLAAGGRSSGDRLLRELQSHWPDYKKNMSGAFTHLLPNLDDAIRAATDAHKDAAATGEPNPSTTAHHLVIALRGIKA